MRGKKEAAAPEGDREDVVAEIEAEMGEACEIGAWMASGIVDAVLHKMWAKETMAMALERTAAACVRKTMCACRMAAPFLIRDEGGLGSWTVPEDFEPEPVDRMAAMFLDPKPQREDLEGVPMLVRITSSTSLYSSGSYASAYSRSKRCRTPSSRPGTSRSRRPDTGPNVMASAFHLELFKRADVKGRGELTADELHTFLSLQASVSLVEVKKLITALGFSGPRYGPDVLASVLTLLQDKAPLKWADSKLVVFPKPPAPLDPQALADEKALRDILAANSKIKVSKDHNLTTSTRSNSLARAFGAGRDVGGLSIDDPRADLEAEWGKCEVTTSQAGLCRLLTGSRGSTQNGGGGSDDRLQGIAAEVKIHSQSPRKGGAEFPYYAGWSKSENLDATRSNLSGVSRPATGRSKGSPQSNTPHGTATQLNLAAALADAAPGFKRRASSIPEPGDRFAPRVASQTSLVEDPNFVLEPGVSANEVVVSRVDHRALKTLARPGPPWPSEPRCMSKSEYQRVAGAQSRPGNSLPSRLSTAPAKLSSSSSGDKQKALQDDSRPDKKPRQQAAPDADTKSVSKNQKPGGRALAASRSLGSVRAPNRRPNRRQVAVGRSDIVADILVLDDDDYAPGRALAGSRPATAADGVDAGSALVSNLSSVDLDDLERLNALEARAIHELRGEAATNRNPKTANLPRSRGPGSRRGLPAGQALAAARSVSRARSVALF